MRGTGRERGEIKRENVTAAYRQRQRETDIDGQKDRERETKGATDRQEQTVTGRQRGSDRMIREVAVILN